MQEQLDLPRKTLVEHTFDCGHTERLEFVNFTEDEIKRGLERMKGPEFCSKCHSTL